MPPTTENLSLREDPPPERGGKQPRPRGTFIRRLTRDSFLGILSGVIGGVFSAIILVSFSDYLRDAAVWVRTRTPPNYVLWLYDPLADGPVNEWLAKNHATYNLYGVRDAEAFEGTFGKRNDDGQTDFDVSFHFKGFARDGFIYFNFSPLHTERYGSGQFQSIERYDRDLYVGVALAQICDEKMNDFRQRFVIGVLTRPDQTNRIAAAIGDLLVPARLPIYQQVFSTRACH